VITVHSLDARRNTTTQREQQSNADNLMTDNINKTKEIVFHRPSARHSLPIPLIGIEQVLSAKLLDVTFCSNLLKFDYL